MSAALEFLAQEIQEDHAHVDKKIMKSYGIGNNVFSSGSTHFYKKKCLVFMHFLHKIFIIIYWSRHNSRCVYSA